MSQEIYMHWGEIIEETDASEDFIKAVWNLSPCEWVFNIECLSYSKGRPAVMYLKNGDPGYPEELAEIELSEDADSLCEKSIREIMTRIPYRWVVPQNLDDLHDMQILDKAIEKYAQGAIESVEEAFFEEMDDDGYGDWLYEQQRDRRDEEND